MDVDEPCAEVQLVLPKEERTSKRRLLRTLDIRAHDDRKGVVIPAEPVMPCVARRSIPTDKTPTQKVAVSIRRWRETPASSEG